MVLSVFRINGLERYWRNLGILCSYGVVFDRIQEQDLPGTPTIVIWNVVFEMQKLCDNLTGNPTKREDVDETSLKGPRSTPWLPLFDRRKS